MSDSTTITNNRGNKPGGKTRQGGFWSRGVTAFFDVRVTHVNSKCNQGKATSTIFKEQEEEKKRKYQQRVLDVEMGSFTPLVLESTVG